MGVDINVYRIRIGLFSMPRKCRFKLDTLCFARATVSNVLRLTLFISILLVLGGDVETNPRPTRPQRQKTFSFAESLASPSSSLSNSPTASNRKQTNVQREQDNEIMSFLRELKDEVKADLKTLNDKMGGVESSISALREENEKLRIENREIKDELSKLYTKMDTLFKDRGHRGIFVNETTPEVLCLLFADDIANCADTAINLQLQINTISEFCNLMGMKVNLGKTQVVVFRNGGPLRSYENWTYNQQPLTVVSVYKYMGLLFSHTLSWGKAHLKLTAQAKKSILAIKTHQKKFGKFSHAEYFKLFDSMIKPILPYGGEIWGLIT